MNKRQGQDAGSRRPAKNAVISCVVFITLLLFVLGCSKDTGIVNDENINPTTSVSSIASQDQSDPTGSEDLIDKKVSLTLYFADGQADKLTKEVRELSTTNDALISLAIGELIAGPEQTGHYATMPEGSKLLSVQLEDGLATLNFSSEFKENHSGGSAGELMTVYSVVNTVTEFENVNKVKFLIEGYETDTLSGHMDLSDSLKREETIIAP